LSGENLLSTDDPVSALIPIMVDGGASAVIVLFRLFPHKSGIEPVDREICEVLANFAGMAVEPHHLR
jgi:CubicO group peptidase (beta-lactamase class C family)